MYAQLSPSGEHAILTAYKRALSYTGKSIYGTVACELGGSNTLISFYVAAMHDGYIIDADPSGRAVPEITHSTYYFNNLPAAPIINANEFGECFISESIMDDQRAETVVRALAKVSRNDIAGIDHILPIEEINGAVIKGTITQALNMGKALRMAKEQNKDVASEIAKEGNGFVAFKGKVSRFKFDTIDGFTIGNVYITGEGKYVGNEYHIQVKNENMVTRLNGEVHVTIPDLICSIDTVKEVPITNPNYDVDMEVAIIILPAPKEFLCEKGLSVFGPSYLNLMAEYIEAKDKFK